MHQYACLGFNIYVGINNLMTICDLPKTVTQVSILRPQQKQRKTIIKEVTSPAI